MFTLNLPLISKLRLWKLGLYLEVRLCLVVLVIPLLFVSLSIFNSLCSLASSGDVI